MKSKQMLKDLEFHDTVPFAQPIFVDVNSRILRWMLNPGQKIEEHQIPDLPLYVIILKGRGMFAGADGQEQEYRVHDLLLFEPGETHTVRALDEGLVFVSFLRGVDTMRPDRIGGEIGRE
jgi:quercetin dioxygenase-like cupin family protein